jgi:hypothetical protein
VPEQFAVQQVFRDGVAVHGYEGTLSALAPSMDLAREHTLAASAFADQEDGRIAGRGPLRVLEQTQHRRISRLEQRSVLQHFAQDAVLRLQNSEFKRALHHVFEVSWSEWLGDVVKCACLHGGYRILDGPRACHQNDERARIATLYLMQQLQAIRLGHSLVAQNEVVVGCGNQLKGPLAALRHLNLVTTLLEAGAQAAANILIVVDDQQLRHGEPSGDPVSLEP